MINRCPAALLTAFLACTMNAPPSVFASSRTQTNSVREKLREKVVKMGVGEKIRVKVDLADESEIKGYLSEVNVEGFVVKDRSTNQDRSFRYDEVKNISRNGGFWSGKKWIFIGAGAFGLAVLLVCGTGHCSQ